MRTIYKNLDKKKFGLIAVLVTLVVINIIWISARRRLAPVDDRRQRLSVQRQRLREEWNTGETLDVRSPQLADFLTGLENPGCSADLKPISAEDKVAASAFAPTFAEYIRTYSENDPDKIFAFMQEAGERLSESSSKLLREASTKELWMKSADVAKLTDRELFSAAWKGIKANPHWDGIDTGSSCISIHEVDSSGLNPEPFFEKDHAVWNQKATFHHLFDPGRKPEDEVRSHGKVLVADARLVIRHDKDKLGVAAPYFFRFWYDSQARRWRPLALTCVSYDMDEYCTIFF